MWVIRHDVAMGLDGHIGVALSLSPWTGVLAAPLFQCSLGGTVFPSNAASGSLSQWGALLKELVSWTQSVSILLDEWVTLSGSSRYHRGILCV